MAVVMFAKMMKLSNLENWGVQFMANRVNFENLATTWDFAKSMRMGSLMKTCINLMQERFRSFVYTDLFLRLPADTVLTLLRNDNLSVDSEEAVFEAISSWVRAGDKECDNQRLRLHAPEMLKEVRWCQTNVEFRSRLVDSHPMFQESTSCARFMAQVEQWMIIADKDKPPCPFNRRRRPPQAIFFLVFGKDKNQDRWSVLRFDPQLEKEERIADMEKREYATYSLVGKSIFVVGGDTAQQEDSTSVEEFLVAERRWRKRASLAVGRSCHAAAVLTEAAGEALLGVFGGYNLNDKYLSSCEVYEVSRDRWFKLPDLREKRSGPAAACLPGDSRVFVFGGANGLLSRLASVEFCQLRADWRERATSSDFWQPAAPMRTARYGLAATHFRGKIIVAGGCGVGGNRLNMVEMFTPPDARCPQGQWTELAGMKESRSCFALLTSTDDAIFALGNDASSFSSFAQRPGNTVETFTAPGGSADVGKDLAAWSWSSKKPLETLAKIDGAAIIRINELARRLDNLPIAATADDAAAAAENASVENRWCQLRDTIQSTALAVLGRSPRHHQDWFDDNDAAIRKLLAEKNRLHKAYVDHPTADKKAAFYRSRRQLHQRLREMQDAWTARKAEEIQGYADHNEWKNFFSAIKAVYGPPTKGTAPLLSADGSTLLTEKTQILQRWAEHFRGVLNRPSTISDAAIDRLPQVETNADLDLPPSLQETIRVVQQLSSGKAPGSDAIPAEVYKHGGPQLMDHLTALFQEMWRQGEVPQDFKDATIVHLYKRKGNRQICDNHRGISLLNIAGKIFARILLNRLNNHLEQGLLPESQCGFRRHRGTTDMIFAARQLQEKCQEMRTHLYSTFVDLTKAFDTVNREGLWKIMQKFGCPERFTQMVRQLHDGMMARVTDNRAVSEAFAVTNGVKQGCVLAPTLFSLMFAVMLMDAYRGDERPGIRIAYRTDGHLLNQRRMHFQSHVSTTTVHELPLAEDCALNTA
ncbi:hypothetical protein SprV_1002838800 [Sparganum proliferum]